MRTHCLLLCLALPLAASLGAARSAQAASAADQAASEALFATGKKLVAAGDCEHAIPKFAESNRLDPGAGTLLNLASCLETLGKLASAWGSFKEAEATARLAGDSTRQAEAARRAEALAPRLSKVAILPPEVAVPSLEVRWDGRPVGEGQMGTEIPVDPGDHLLEAAAPGKKPWRTTVRVELVPGSTSVRIPALVAGSASGTGASGGTPWWTGQRIGGAAIVGVGLAGVVVGSVLGALTLKKISDSKSEGHCTPSLTVCDATGLQMQADAHTLAHGSTAGLFVGGAAMVTGVILLATGGNSPARSSAGRVTVGPMAGEGTGGVFLLGRW